MSYHSALVDMDVTWELLMLNAINGEQEIREICGAIQVTVKDRFKFMGAWKRAMGATVGGD